MKRLGNARSLNTSQRLICLFRKRLQRQFNVAARRGFGHVDIVPERSPQHRAAKRGGLIGNGGEHGWIRLKWGVRVEKGSREGLARRIKEEAAVAVIRLIGEDEIGAGLAKGGLNWEGRGVPLHFNSLDRCLGSLTCLRLNCGDEKNLIGHGPDVGVAEHISTVGPLSGQLDLPEVE